MRGRRGFLASLAPTLAAIAGVAKIDERPDAQHFERSPAWETVTINVYPATTPTRDEVARGILAAVNRRGRFPR